MTSPRGCPAAGEQPLSQPRIAIVGVGAIGGAVAGALVDAGHTVDAFCARSPFDALEVHHPRGTTRVEAPVAMDPAQAERADWVFLGVKAHQTEAARPWFDALVGAGTHVVVLQNGVDHVERVAPMVHADAVVIPVVVQISAEKVAAGRIEQGLDGVLQVPDDAGGQALEALMGGAAMQVQVMPDIVTAAWNKLAMNAALGGVCTLLLTSNGAAGEEPARSIVVGAMEEVAAVARAEGANFPDERCARILDAVTKAAGEHWSSIAVDLREGRPLEWEVRNAIVGVRGRKHGVPTPLNDALTTLLQAVDPAGAIGR